MSTIEEFLLIETFLKPWSTSKLQSLEVSGNSSVPIWDQTPALRFILGTLSRCRQRRQTSGPIRWRIASDRDRNHLILPPQGFERTIHPCCYKYVLANRTRHQPGRSRVLFSLGSGSLIRPYRIFENGLDISGTVLIGWLTIPPILPLHALFAKNRSSICWMPRAL